MKLLNQTSLALLFTLAASTSFAQQVCNSNVEQNTPDSRFELTAGEALDTQTGLIWQRCLLGQTWNSATAQCEGFLQTVNWKEALESASGNWRVPNIKELGSIVEHACGNPSINLNVFPGTPITPSIWTSTPGRFQLGQTTQNSAWSTFFQDGTSLNGSKDFRRYVLLVRDTD